MEKSEAVSSLTVKAVREVWTVCSSWGWLRKPHAVGPQSSRGPRTVSSRLVLYCTCICVSRSVPVWGYEAAEAQYWLIAITDNALTPILKRLHQKNLFKRRRPQVFMQHRGLFTRFRERQRGVGWLLAVVGVGGGMKGLSCILVFLLFFHPGGILPIQLWFKLSHAQPTTTSFMYLSTWIYIALLSRPLYLSSYQSMHLEIKRGDKKNAWSGSLYEIGTSGPEDKLL